MISNELKEGVPGVDSSRLFSAQNRRLIKLTTPAINEQELLLESFSGTEALSTLFSFELSLLSQDARLELKSLIGQPAQLEIELATGELRYIHGFISRFSLQDSDNGLARYTATLGPWLWMLTRRQDSRVFQEQTVEAIIRSVLAGYGTLPVFEFRLIQPLKVHSYITQYRESDQAFVMRLLEQEGLFFYFVHEKDIHTLIVSNHSPSLTPIPQQPQIRYHSASVTELADSITQWSSHRTLQSGRMSLRTFDYKQPRNALSVGIASVNEQGTVDPYEIYDLSGHYTHATG
ncbi:type VI secretion system Vgr family protein, partial [Pseudomonas sp. RA_15y_Pfl1_P12]